MTTINLNFVFWEKKHDLQCRQEEDKMDRHGVQIVRQLNGPRYVE